MTLLKHEIKQGWKSFIIFTGAIGAFIIACIMLYPEMKGEMNEMGDMFSSMGVFSEAFGMDRLNFGTLIGFYGIECGNILGIGGALFAALIGIGALAKEEKEKTAEFLLSHPIKRSRVVTEKLLAVLVQIVVLNVLVFGMTVASIAIIGEEIPWKEICLLHLGYFLVQVVLAGICFGISAFIRRGGLGIGIGIAAVMYFLNIVANITEKAEDLKYITPFGFADAADIISELKLDTTGVAICMVMAVLGVIAAYFKYTRKDIS